jgi:uncharacterized membrane protein HdeD (DUF308 family)
VSPTSDLSPNRQLVLAACGAGDVLAGLVLLVVGLAGGSSLATVIGAVLVLAGAGMLALTLARGRSRR